MKKLGINPEEMPQNIKKILQENTNLKSKIVSQDELDNLMKENRQMKKEIHNLQVKLQQTEGTESSLDTQYARYRKNEKEL